MAINKKVEITWKDAKHSLLLTMRHVDEIESDFNLIQFANQLNENDIRYTKVSWLIAKFLQLAGAEVTQDDVWEEIFAGNDVSPIEAALMGQTIAAACLPEIPEEAVAKKKSTKKKSKKVVA